MQEIEITNKQKFAAQMRMIAHNNDLNLVEAVTSYCEDNEFHMEDVIPLFDHNMKEELRVCATENRMIRGIKKINTLF